MKIFVTLKRLPDSETKVKIASDKKTFDATDVNYIVNPYDEFAIEQAIQLQGETTIINVDKELFTKEIRTGLAMEIDKAVFLKLEGEVDNFKVAKAIAKYIKTKEFDMLLLGKQAIDDDSHCVGQMIATLLNIPCVSDINSMKVEGKKVTVKRGIEGGEEIIQVELPAVFTCDKSLNNPRLANLMGIKKAKNKPLEEHQAVKSEPTLHVESMSLPNSRQAGKIVGEGADAAAPLVNLLRNEAKVL